MACTVKMGLDSAGPVLTMQAFRPLLMAIPTPRAEYALKPRSARGT